MKSKIISPPKLIILLSFLFLFFFQKSSCTPLSLCSQGTFSYIKDSSINSDTCNLSSGLSNTYPAAVNSAFFSTSEKCGICYEMVGPSGAIKIRIEDSTTDSNDDESIPHFKVGEKAAFALLGVNNTNELNETRKISVSLRMITCDYGNNVTILTGEDNNEGYSFSCLVRNHDIAVSYIRLKENEGTSFIKLERDKNNYFTYNKDDLINYPVTIRIGAISSEYVNLTINSAESDETYQSNGNFKNSGNSYYSIDTLKKDKDITEVEQCCSVDYSSYSSIFSSGELNTNYEKENYNSTLTTSSTGNTLNISFSNYGKLIIKSTSPVRADQFIAVSLSLKGNKVCRECLYISAYGKSADSKIQITSADTTRSYQYTFENLGVEDNTFNGIILYTKDKTLDISIDNINLVENSDAPSTQICLGNTTDWIPVVPSYNENETNINNSEIIITTIIDSTIVIDNNTNSTNSTEEKIEINIKNISLINSSFILIQSENFTVVNNESIELNFTSSLYNFKTIECYLNNGNNTYINSFNCQIPNISNISNGTYIPQISSGSVYHINSTEKIRINNGSLLYIYTPVIIPIPTPVLETTIIVPDTQSQNTSKVNETNSTRTTTPINNDIVIINSLTKSINKGDNITFSINPIESRYYNQIDQIIFIDNNSQSKNALYLKNCKNNASNNKATSISCKVSNNLIKGNYTSLASGQDIKISSGQKINLISTTSTGGIFSQDINQTVNANISRREKRNYTLTFKITYYGQDLKPNATFPYSVSMSGIKKLQNLKSSNYEVNYNSNIQFPNCTMGNYSSQNSQAIEGIKCHLPDFIPAGTYTKLSSDGFDVNPNNKINIEFPYDFNKSENYITSASNGTRYYNTESSSSSKTWIIWVVLGVLVAVLAAVIIIAFCVNKKRNGKNDESNPNNDSGVNQINNSNAMDNSINKHKEDNKSNNNNSMSKSS